MIDDKTLALFWSRVNIGGEDDCWEWKVFTQSKKKMRYPTFRQNNKNMNSHRFSWIIHNGPIPEGMLVLHRCDNPPCVNPNHLFLGTHLDNARDKIEKGRGGDTANTGNRTNRRNCKFTEKEVKEIRDLYSTGEFLYKELAVMFGAGYSTIGHIITRKTWSDVQ